MRARCLITCRYPVAPSRQPETLRDAARPWRAPLTCFRSDRVFVYKYHQFLSRVVSLFRPSTRRYLIPGVQRRSRTLSNTTFSRRFITALWHFRSPSSHRLRLCSVVMQESRNPRSTEAARGWMSGVEAVALAVRPACVPGVPEGSR